MEHTESLAAHAPGAEDVRYVRRRYLTPAVAQARRRCHRDMRRFAARGTAHVRAPESLKLAGVSGTSSFTPSMAISRRFPSHAPGVPATASGTATRSNSIFSGASPSRSRACEIAPVVGTNHSFTHRAEDNG